MKRISSCCAARAGPEVRPRRRRMVRRIHMAGSGGMVCCVRGHMNVAGAPGSGSQVASRPIRWYNGAGPPSMTLSEGILRIALVEVPMRVALSRWLLAGILAPAAVQAQSITPTKTTIRLYEQDGGFV